jgi:hypothetical protein
MPKYKYSVAFTPKKGYRNKNYYVRGNNLPKLLQMIDKHIKRNRRNPWEYVHIMRYGSAETLLFFKIDN